MDNIEAIASAGADLLKLGKTFPNSPADSSSIQYFTQIALESQTNVAECFRLVVELRSRGVDHPIPFIGNISSNLAFGIERFVPQVYDKCLGLL